MSQKPYRLLFLAVLLACGLGLAGATAADAQTWTNAPNSPFAYNRFDAEYAFSTDLVYFLGGRLADTTQTDGSIWSFDPATGIYTDTTVDMPVPVSNYEIARLVDADGNEVLVIFGGRPAPGGVVNTVQGFYPGSNAVVVFDADPYPIATSPGGVAVVGNLAYSFGGFDATQVTANTYIFDITAAEGTRWTTGPPLSLPRSYLGAAVVDNFIYAIGGATWDGASLFASPRVERLDTTNPAAWDDAGVADLPGIGCDEMRAYGFGANSPYDLVNKIVFAGCGQWPNEIAESMLYDVATNTWDTTFPDLVNPRRNHAGAFIPWGPGSGGRPGLWVWGGRQAADTTVLTIPEFYPFAAGVLFIDGFESGTTLAWSFALP